MNVQLKDCTMFIKKELRFQYSDNELRNFIYMIFEQLLGFSKTDVQLKTDTPVPEAKYLLVKEITRQLKENKPIQYILGKTEFYGCWLNVTPGVLIPRPETEELVDWILKDTTSEKLKVLDIGCGSGSIAIALAKNLKNAEVDACDISVTALDIASKNAITNEVSINFHHFDILCKQPLSGSKKFDIIVSNPPYVRVSEKVFMKPNVLNYEPPEALFVKDEEPLIFYDAIAGFALTHLDTDGTLYLEINEKLAADTAGLFEKNGFSSTCLKKDINGKNRMLRIKNSDR